MRDRPRRRRSLRAAHRLSALAVTLLWCAAPILAAIHAYIEVDRYCAQHGSVEEARKVDAPRPAPGPDTGATAEGELQRLPAHEACGFGKVCRFGQVIARLILDAADAPE